MRLMLVVHGFPPDAGGGTEIYVHDLARSLRNDFGDDVLVLAREADPGRPEMAVRREERGGVRLVFVNNTFRAGRSFADTYRNPSITGLAARVAEEFSPDAVHVHHLTGLSTDLVGALAGAGLPVIVTLNDYWLICQRGQLLDLDYERCPGPWPEGCARCLHTDARAAAERLRHAREVLGQARLLLAPSPTLRQRFLEIGIDGARLCLVEQGIDHAPFLGISRTPPDRLRLGFAGSLMVAKAPHVALEAFGRLPEGEATLTLYGAYAPYHGDDRYRSRLDPMLAQSGVFHAGAVPHARMPEAFAAMDALVVPSIWIENAPFVIREAFVAGVPVIASDLGGMRDLVKHDTSGLLFRPGDAADLGRALRRLREEPNLLPRLRRGIPPVKTIQQDAAETRQRHRQPVPAVADAVRAG
jgi:glycosyltransferase involved in cell wall biosynthesis